MATSESRGVGVSQSNLHQQDLSKLDVSKLTAVSPEVISRQATINIGTIGHVAHGKSTVVKAISGVQTVRFKNELERNITIKLDKLPGAVVDKYTCPESKKSTKRKASIDVMTSKKSKKQKTKEQDEEYIVESVLDLQAVSGNPLFFIKWKGWPHSTNTWEPIDNLQNCIQLVETFLNNRLKQYADKVQEFKEQLFKYEPLDRVQLEAQWSASGHDQDGRNIVLSILLCLCNLPSEETEWMPALKARAVSAMQQEELYKARQKQLEDLRNWEVQLNSTDPDGKISVINDVDLEGPPSDFCYINQNVPAAGIIVPEDPPIGCDCTSCNIRSKCSCALEGGLYAYTFKKRLRAKVGTPIYECNKACSCPSTCTNRVVQTGRMVRLHIFRTSSGCGWGVRAGQRIPEGQFVCQYLGEIISCEEAELRARSANPSDPTYLFDLDFNSADSLYTVDAARMGNISHFINHSCEPNLGVWAVWGNCLDPNLPMLALFATRDINFGEEITFDYAQKTSGEEPSDPESNIQEGLPSEALGDSTPKKSQPPPEKVLRSPLKLRMDFGASELSERIRPVCKCGAKSCRKYLF